MDDSFVNPWKEVILISGASESAPVGCFIISLSIYYWLFKCGVLHIVCVCVCVRERERETGSHHSGVSCLNRGLCANTYEHHHWVCHVTLFPFRAWTDGKTKDIINSLLSLHLSWKLKLAIMERDIPTRACGVRPITMHRASWPIRADCACRKEELCRKRSVWERRGIEDLQ